LPATAGELLAGPTRRPEDCGRQPLEVIPHFLFFAREVIREKRILGRAEEAQQIVLTRFFAIKQFCPNFMFVVLFNEPTLALKRES
jgi:hypothetical protein